MSSDSILIQDVPEEISSQEQLEEYDSVTAYHGTTHRFQEAIEEYGLVPGTDLMPVEGQTTDQEIVYFGPETDEEVDEMNAPWVEMYSDAESYAARAVKDTVGGVPLIVECELPVENLVADDVSQVDLRGVETPYESITQYATVGHEGTVEPEKITGFQVDDSQPVPPHNNSAYQKTDEHREWVQAMGDMDVDKMVEIGSGYDLQVDPEEFTDSETIHPSELLRQAHPELF